MTQLDFHKDPSILSSVVDVMADGVFTVDANGHFVAWSAGAERITGPPPAGICNQECKVQAKDGCELYLHGNVRVVTDERDAILGAVGTFTDLPSFILANERIAILEEQTKSRGAFQQMVGESDAMQEVFRRLCLAAQSDVTVLLTGESGTG
jgi:two-component system, NtrC family, response regulator HydG